MGGHAAAVPEDLHVDLAACAALGQQPSAQTGASATRPCVIVLTHIPHSPISRLRVLPWLCASRRIAVGVHPHSGAAQPCH